MWPETVTPKITRKASTHTKERWKDHFGDYRGLVNGQTLLSVKRSPEESPIGGSNPFDTITEPYVNRCRRNRERTLRHGKDSIEDTITSTSTSLTPKRDSIIPTTLWENRLTSQVSVTRVLITPTPQQTVCLSDWRCLGSTVKTTLTFGSNFTDDTAPTPTGEVISRRYLFPLVIWFLNV